MHFDALSLAINVALPLALVTLWLVAEFRWRKSARIGLGLGCMLLLCLWIAAAMYSGEMQLGLHRACLGRIEHMLAEGQNAQARRALQVYRQKYQETHSTRAAVSWMHKTLSERPLDAPVVTEEKKR